MLKYCPHTITQLIPENSNSYKITLIKVNLKTERGTSEAKVTYENLF